MKPRVALLTGGGDRPYALGLASSLAAKGVALDFIGSDFLDAPELRQNPLVRFLNLRGDVRADATLVGKVARVAKYYGRLVLYAAGSDAPVFHILWNNRLEWLDRTALMLFYRLLGKRVVLTVHNVNIRKRDGNDGPLNRRTLAIQYRLADHLFLHTERMKQELQDDFGVPAAKISVIPFGINSTVPNTATTASAARVRLGLGAIDKVVLFFGNIAPYKGLEHLVEATALAVPAVPEIRLVIAGRPKGHAAYWAGIEGLVANLGLRERVVERIEYIPDDEIELFFKAADVLVLPYLNVFQSGVLFLGYNFGLPVIASDVASLKDDIVEERTGFVCKPSNPASLAERIGDYFRSALYRDLAARRPDIRRYAEERYSWEKVAAITVSVYDRLRDRVATD